MGSLQEPQLIHAFTHAQNAPAEIQLFRERLSEKSVHATIPNGNNIMGYDQYTVPDDCSCQTYFCCFPLALANICPWPVSCYSYKFL